MIFLQTKCVACNNDLPNPISSKVGILCPICKQQGLFRKKLVITGITRMNHGHVCVSGIDAETGRFVRPVYPSGLDRDFVMEGATQVVRHFNVVEMEFREYRPNSMYHTEDWIINEKFAPRYLGHLKDETIIKLLKYKAIDNLKEAIERQDKSLFIVRAKMITNVWHEQWEKFKVRMNFTDWSGNQFEKIPVTDLLVLAKVRWMVQNKRYNYANEIMHAFNNNPYRYIRIGLTREFMGQRWKQVTALMTIPDMFHGESFVDYEKKLGEQV